ncbi:MAG TPA: prepilin-type N-terminal cleavage/methylation domain-containing protein [Gemmatimonadaceae bacterium]|jgi:Tfp pilus assembly protein PilV
MQSRRAGFTLVEVLIAVMLIDVGLLALVAGSAVLVRRAAEVRTRSSALRAANNRIQTLSVATCGAASGAASGAAATGNVREAWTVTLQPNHVRELRDSVAFTIAGDNRSVTLVTRLPC